MANFDEVGFSQIPRANNTRADALAKLASSPTGDLNPTIYVEYLASPSIDKEVAMEIETTTCWIDPIRAYLERGILPEDEVESKRIERRTPSSSSTKESFFENRSPTLKSILSFNV